MEKPEIPAMIFLISRLILCLPLAAINQAGHHFVMLSRSMYGNLQTKWATLSAPPIVPSVEL